MEMNKFPSCCKAHIIHNFPFTNNNDYTFEQIKTYVQRQMDRYFKQGHATLIAILRDDQKSAEQALLDLGWECTEPMKRYNNIVNANPVYNPYTLKIFYCRFDQFEDVK